MLNYSNEVYMYTYICRSTKVHCHKSFGSCPCCPCSGIYSCSVPLKGFCESGKIGENIYRFKTLLYSVQCTVYSVQCTCSFVSFCENKFTFKGVKSKIFNLVIQSNWSSDV